jgi:hypothetical protein
VQGRTHCGLPQLTKASGDIAVMALSLKTIPVVSYLVSGHTPVRLRGPPAQNKQPHSCSIEAKRATPAKRGRSRCKDHVPRYEPYQTQHSFVLSGMIRLPLESTSTGLPLLSRSRILFPRLGTFNGGVAPTTVLHLVTNHVHPGYTFEELAEFLVDETQILKA